MFIRVWKLGSLNFEPSSDDFISQFTQSDTPTHGSENNLLSPGISVGMLTRSTHIAETLHRLFGHSSFIDIYTCLWYGIYCMSELRHSKSNKRETIHPDPNHTPAIMHKNLSVPCAIKYYPYSDTPIRHLPFRFLSPYLQARSNQKAIRMSLPITLLQHPNFRLDNLNP